MQRINERYEAKKEPIDYQEAEEKPRGEMEYSFTNAPEINDASDSEATQKAEDEKSYGYSGSEGEID